jgi:SAM-dependent methyltransferase
MANEQMREQWTTGAAGWVEHRDLFETELEGFSDALVAAAPPRADDIVLDVGCGTGGLAARYLAGGARVVGADISPVMVDAATASVPGAEFVVADAQTEDLSSKGPFTKVVSRFGVMFFDDPVAAFSNILGAVAPSGELGFICWRALEENPMFTLGTSVLLDHLEPTPPPPAAGVPGPLAFAEVDRVRSILEQAGWGRIVVDPVDVTCDYSRDGSDGVEERLTMVLNTTSGRGARAQLEPRLGPRRWAALLDLVRVELRERLVDGRLAFNGAGWLVTANAPG